MDFDLAYPKAAGIDSVQTQQRHTTRIGQCRPAMQIAENIRYTKGSDQILTGLIVPVVEIAGNNERRCRWHQTLHACGQRRQLSSPSTCKQAKMHTKTVQMKGLDRHLAMQQTALLEAVIRNILVFGGDDRVAAENGVTVVAMLIHRVTAIGKVRPHLIGEELILRRCRPVGQTQGMLRIFSLHFLQENNIGVNTAQVAAKFMHHHAPVEVRKPFVNVIRGNAQLHGEMTFCQRDRPKSQYAGIVACALGTFTLVQEKFVIL